MNKQPTIGEVYKRPEYFDAVWSESIECYGVTKQSIVCMEECAELIEAYDVRRLRTEQERKEFEERYGLRLEMNTPLSPFLERLMLGIRHSNPVFPNVSHRTVPTNMGAWNPQTVRKNTKRITDENMLQKVMGKNA